MSKANQQNHSPLRTATQLGLVGVLAASLASACVNSNSGNTGTGGVTGEAGGVPAGGVPAGGVPAGGVSAGGVPAGGVPAGGVPAGGTIALVCPAATSYLDCTLTTGVTTGTACAPKPLIFALDANCTIGLWSGDGISSGYFYQPWCNNANTTCTMTMTCAANSMHIAGSYLGSSTSTMDGNAGWGAHLQVNSSDAGTGCQMIDVAALTGLTLDINTTTIPTGNHLYIGINLANGNDASYTAVLTAGAQTLKIPWACFKNNKSCGSVPGPGITDFYVTFDWFNDAATHAADITISNLGFY